MRLERPTGFALLAFVLLTGTLVAQAPSPALPWSGSTLPPAVVEARSLASSPDLRAISRVDYAKCDGVDCSIPWTTTCYVFVEVENGVPWQYCYTSNQL